MSSHLKTIALASVFSVTALLTAVSAQAASNSWSAATATTRESITALQEQAQAGATARTKAQAQQQLKLQNTLELMQKHQKELIEQNRKILGVGTSSDVPEFRPRPRTAQPSNNPWLKKNPWHDTQKNPFAGKKYEPNSRTRFDGIYVKPKTDSTSSTETPSKPVNIFK